MWFQLAGDRARVLGKFVQFFSKVGMDLYIEAVVEGLILGTANSSSSGFARIQLCPAFFLDYSVEPDQIESGENCCRVSLKACAAVFKSMKNVDTCKIKMNITGGKLIFQLHCKQSTTKTHYISILEQETLTAPSRSQDSTINTLTASQKVFADILSIFNSNEEELTIEASKSSISVKNYIESLHANRQQMRTQLSLDPAEFDLFVIGQETSLTFCLKEWRAFLILAESLNLDITINFETSGHPVEFTIHDLDLYAVTLYMSTLSSDLDSSKDQSGYIATDVGALNKSQVRKRGHGNEAVEAAVSKKPKGRTKEPNQDTRLQFSNPDIEGSETTTKSSNGSTTNNNRWTVARAGRDHITASSSAEDVPSIASANTNETIRSIGPVSNNVDVIFLRDTEEDSDRTLSNIPMRPNIDFVASQSKMPEFATTNTTPTTNVTINDDAAAMVPESPPSRSVERRQEAISLFRRCFEPTFRSSNVTGLRNILAESSDDDDA